MRVGCLHRYVLIIVAFASTSCEPANHSAALLPASTAPLAIVHLGNSTQQRRAAKELRRFVYVLTGYALPIALRDVSRDEMPHGGVVLGTVANVLAVMAEMVTSTYGGAMAGSVLGAAARELLTTGTAGSHAIHAQSRDPPLLVCLGLDDTATLYAAYTLLESMGIRFRIDGDVVPSRLRGRMPPSRLLAAAAEQATGQPIAPSFDDRGLLPFHDFLQGPDLWNEQDSSIFVIIPSILVTEIFLL